MTVIATGIEEIDGSGGVLEIIRCHVHQMYRGCPAVTYHVLAVACFGSFGQLNVAVGSQSQCTGDSEGNRTGLA